MLQVSDKERKNRLKLDNPWWSGEPQVAVSYRDKPRRQYFALFRRLAIERSVNRALVLMGPRRVGKTVMLHQFIQHLLETGTPPRHILFVSIDTPLYSGLALESLLELYLELQAIDRDSALTVIFDEVQYLPKWEVHLKSLVDTYPSSKFIVSGSAAAALKLASLESGAGRFTDFMLPPLTFSEYLDFIGYDVRALQARSGAGDGTYGDRAAAPQLDIVGLNERFIEYLNYGGYPEAVFSPEIQANCEQYLRSDIIDKVLLRDLPTLYGIQDIQELNRLFTTLAYNTGQEVSLEKLSSDSGVAKNTLRRYIEYLEAAFLVRRVERVDMNARRFKRAHGFKVYLTNPSMRAALFGKIDPDGPAAPALAETALFSQWLHSEMVRQLYYSRWDKGKGGEVDMVLLDNLTFQPRWCIEVKWSDKAANAYRKLDGLLDFCQKNDVPLHDVVVTSRLQEGLQTVGEHELRFVPTAVQVYLVGYNLVRQVLEDDAVDRYD